MNQYRYHILLVLALGVSSICAEQTEQPNTPIQATQELKHTPCLQEDPTESQHWGPETQDCFGDDLDDNMLEQALQQNPPSCCQKCRCALELAYEIAKLHISKHPIAYGSGAAALTLALIIAYRLSRTNYI